MNIVVAKHSGFCYGVKNAVQKTKDTLNEFKSVYTTDMIVHNEHIIKELSDSGLKVVQSIDEIPYNATILLRAHGVSIDYMKKCEERNLNMVDLTCSNVKKIHEIVNKYSKDGYKIVVIGDKEHAEVKGILGWISRRI